MDQDIPNKALYVLLTLRESTLAKLMLGRKDIRLSSGATLRLFSREV